MRRMLAWRTALLSLCLFGCAQDGVSPTASAYREFPPQCLYRPDFGNRYVLTAEPPKQANLVARRATSEWQSGMMLAECMCRTGQPLQPAEIEQVVQRTLSTRGYNTPTMAVRVTTARRAEGAGGHPVVSLTGVATHSTMPGWQYAVEVTYVVTDRCLEMFMAAEAGGLSAQGRGFLGSVQLASGASAAPAAATTPPATMPEARLRNLQQLRDQGLISQREFDDTRRRIISGL